MVQWLAISRNQKPTSAQPQVLDEVLHLFASRFAKSLDAAEIRCVGLDQVGIELLLADDLAETIANCATTVVSVGALQSVARSCEAFLLAGSDAYKKEGTRLLQQLIGQLSTKSLE